MSLSHDLEPARQDRLTGHDGDGVAPVFSWSTEVTVPSTAASSGTRMILNDRL
jgi:hypothetical protein